MTNEEKAKAYDEALERARKHGTPAMPLDPKRSVGEQIFPELAASEDEKIRKELLNAFQESEDSLYMVLTPHKRESFIAWLEKQGEHANFRNNIQVGDKVTRYEDGVLVNLSQLERVAKPSKKQGEQKSTWSEEDEKMRKKLLFLMEEENSISSWEGCYEWLKSLKPNHWKPSEE